MVIKIAVVTGSNKGLGLSIVKGLCQKFNGIVYLTARCEEKGKYAVKQLNSINLFPEFHQLDVTDEKSVQNFADFIKENHGGLDVLVNNAGILEFDHIYPTYEAAKRNIDTNYKSLLTVEKYLYGLMRNNSRIVNVSSACGVLSNLNNQRWIEKLKDKDLNTEDINSFVDEYLESVKNGNFDKKNFADDGKHAEHRVSKIALTALTMVQQRKYFDRYISLNVVHPGFVMTDMANGAGEITADEAAKVVLYLILEASPNLKGVFLWNDKTLIDWSDENSDNYCQGIW